MRFVDASVFVHAFIKPKRKLKHHEVEIKESAKKIVERINEGEKVGITVIQLSEIANILEKYMRLSDALEVERFLILADNVKVFEVSEEDCALALQVAEEKKIGLSDAVAYVIMRREGVSEIYSFDGDFDKLEGISRIIT